MLPRPATPPPSSSSRCPRSWRPCRPKACRPRRKPADPASWPGFRGRGDGQASRARGGARIPAGLALSGARLRPVLAGGVGRPGPAHLGGRPSQGGAGAQLLRPRNRRGALAPPLRRQPGAQEFRHGEPRRADPGGRRRADLRLLGKRRRDRRRPSRRDPVAPPAGARLRRLRRQPRPGQLAGPGRRGAGGADHPRRPSYLLGLEAATGKTLWKHDRPAKVAWTTPVLAQRPGRSSAPTAASRGSTSRPAGRSGCSKGWRRTPAPRRWWPMACWSPPAREVATTVAVRLGGQGELRPGRGNLAGQGSERRLRVAGLRRRLPDPGQQKRRRRLRRPGDRRKPLAGTPGRRTVGFADRRRRPGFFFTKKASSWSTR